MATGQATTLSSGILTSDCDRFVHMDSEEAAKSAVQELNGHTIKGRNMKVEFSSSTGSGRKNTQKLFVGNIADGTTDQVRQMESVIFSVSFP